MDPNTARIFISYRREDSRGYAGRLADDLSELFGAGRVFFDVATLSVGQNFAEVITQAVDGSAAVVVVIGPHWATISDDVGRRLDAPQDYVRLEVAAALSASKPLLPVLVGDAEMPSARDMPPELVRLTQYNALELSDSRWRYDFGRLVDALERLDLTPHELQPFPEQRVAGRAERREAWLASGDVQGVRERVESFVGWSRWRSDGWLQNVLELRAGSKLGSRLLGGFFVREEFLPTKAKIRLSERGGRVLVEALIVEDFGPGAFTGMGSRYQTVLENWMNGLRRATGASDL